MRRRGIDGISNEDPDEESSCTLMKFNGHRTDMYIYSYCLLYDRWNITFLCFSVVLAS